MFRHDFELANDHLTLSVQECHGRPLLAKLSVDLSDVDSAVHTLLQCKLLRLQLGHTLLRESQLVANIDWIVSETWTLHRRAADVDRPVSRVSRPFWRTDGTDLITVASAMSNGLGDTSEQTLTRYIYFFAPHDTTHFLFHRQVARRIV